MNLDLEDLFLKQAELQGKEMIVCPYCQKVAIVEKGKPKHCDHVDCVRRVFKEVLKNLINEE